MRFQFLNHFVPGRAGQVMVIAIGAVIIAKLGSVDAECAVPQSGKTALTPLSTCWQANAMSNS